MTKRNLIQNIGEIRAREEPLIRKKFSEISVLLRFSRSLFYEIEMEKYKVLHCVSNRDPLEIQGYDLHRH